MYLHLFCVKFFSLWHVVNCLGYDAPNQRSEDPSRRMENAEGETSLRLANLLLLTQDRVLITVRELELATRIEDASSDGSRTESLREE